MIPEISADFGLLGTEILPDEITQLLGITPTETWLAGDIVPKTKLRRKQNAWIFAVGGLEHSYEVSDYLIPLINVLLPKAKIITEICDKYALDSEFSIAVYIHDQTPSINIDQKIISALNDLRTTIDIDLILTSG